MCMFTDGSDYDIHAEIAKDDAAQATLGPGHYFVLVRCPCFLSGVHVKEAQFFIDQGGLLEEWGSRWRGPIWASSGEKARRMGLIEERLERGLDPDMAEPRWGCICTPERDR